MNLSNGTSRARREVLVVRLVFWIGIGLVLVVVGACAALSRPPNSRHLEIAPDPPVHPLPIPVGPEPPEEELVA